MIADDPLRWWSEVAGQSSRLDRSVSLELRWFGTGRPPADLQRLAATGSRQVRTDRYAVIDRDDLSLKRRGRTRMSLKQRRCQVPVLDGLPLAERWSRRTGRQAPIERLEQGFAWLPVAKRRLRLLIDLSGPEPQRCVERRSTLVRGGSVEVVQIEVGSGGAQLWSAAGEAWGPDDRDGLGRLLRWSNVDWWAIDQRAWMAGSYPAVLRRSGPEGTPTRPGRTDPA